MYKNQNKVGMNQNENQNHLSNVHEIYLEILTISNTSSHFRQTQSSNQMTQFPVNFSWLRELNCAHTNIRLVSPQMLESLPQLRILILAYNPITSFTLPTEPLKYLHTLDLFNTFLPAIPELSGLSTLEIFSISNPGLIFLDPPKDSKLPNSLKTFRVEHSLDSFSNLWKYFNFQESINLSSLSISFSSNTTFGRSKPLYVPPPTPLPLLHFKIQRKPDFPEIYFDRNPFDNVFPLLRSLDLNNLGIKYLPTLNLPHLTHIYLQRNSLSDVKDFFKSNLPRLCLVNLKFNSIRRFNIVASTSFPSLIKLLLGHNRIISFNPGRGCNFPKLQHLDLSYNSLISFPPSSIFPSLILLNLLGNQIQLLTPDFGKSFPVIEELDLSQNDIHQICCTCPYLTTLILHGNKIQTLTPDFAHKFPRLLKLNLSRNMIGSLSLSQLPTSLKYFYFSSNQASFQLPQSSSSPKILESFDSISVPNNIDYTLKSETMNRYDFEHVDLSNNVLASFVCDKIQSSILVLNTNVIKEMSISPQMSETVSMLDLSSNDLHTFSTVNRNNIPLSMIVLRKLVLEHNQLKHIEINPRHFPKLEILDLGYNQFQSLDKIFSFDLDNINSPIFPLLHKLSICGNPIFTLDCQVLHSVDISQQINGLDENEETPILNGFFHIFPSLVYIDVGFIPMEHTMALEIVNYTLHQTHTIHRDFRQLRTLATYNEITQLF